ncbi:hypothetical protein APSETT445_003691 [Aspergillus pseudonomiae]
MVERVTFREGCGKYEDICAQSYAFPAEVAEQMTVRVKQDELLKPETEIGLSAAAVFFNGLATCAYYVL